jgi:phage shock protein C
MKKNDKNYFTWLVRNLNTKQPEQLFTEKKELSKSKQSRMLFRSRHDYMFAGVLGGLAVYWKKDSTVIRLFFLLFTLLTGGLTVIIYFIMLKVIPIEPEKDEYSRKK